MVPQNGLRQWDDDIAKIMDDGMFLRNIYHPNLLKIK
jgi:hypothetical protein